jgi:hypothetical protein
MLTLYKRLLPWIFLEILTPSRFSADQVNYVPVSYRTTKNRTITTFLGTSLGLICIFTCP